VKPYNKKAKCPKCHNKDIGNGWKHKDAFDFRCPHSGTEHIDRHCRNCHYEWAEKPLDKVKKRKD